MLETDGIGIGISVGKCRHAQIKKIGLKVEKALPCNCDDNSDFEDTLGSFCKEDNLFGFKKETAQIGVESGTGGDDSDDDTDDDSIGVATPIISDNIKVTKKFFKLNIDLGEPRQIPTDSDLESYSQSTEDLDTLFGQLRDDYFRTQINYVLGDSIGMDVKTTEISCQPKVGKFTSSAKCPHFAEH